VHQGDGEGDEFLAGCRYRLQELPEDFVIPVSDNQTYKQFGDSVAVPVIRELARRIVKEMDKVKKRKSKLYSN